MWNFSNISKVKFSLAKVLFTALFKNMQTLKSKSQQTFVFFTAVIHPSGPLRKQKFTLLSSKVHSLRFMIGGF